MTRMTAQGAGGTLVIAMVMATATAQGGGPIVSTFSADAEGWIIKDLNCNNYGAVLGTYAVNWYESGGDPGGHIGRVDPTSNCYFFDAPPAFLGDRSDFAGMALRFSLRTTVSDWPPGSVIVLIGDNGKVLVSDIADPDDEWTRYVVPLTAPAFRLNSQGGPVVSEQAFLAVLADLEALRISAEYGSDQGEETTFLDTVQFGVPLCPADLDSDGQVNGADLGILLGEWGQGGGIADLDGTGLVDGADLGILLASWGTCLSGQ